MGGFIKTKNVGNGVFDLRHHNGITEFRPDELYLKEDGDVNDEPCFCIVMTGPENEKVCGQFSLNTISEAMNELGYEIKKIK